MKNTKKHLILYKNIFLKKFMENGPGEYAKSRKKDRSNRTRQNNKRADRKIESYDSPEIPGGRRYEVGPPFRPKQVLLGF